MLLTFVDFQLLMDDLVCPITLDKIRDPVRTLAGIIYERQAVESWLKIHSFDPVTRLVLPSDYLSPVTLSNLAQTPTDFRKELKWTVCVPLYHISVEMDTKFAPDALNTLEYSLARLQHFKSNPMIFFMGNVNSDEIDRELGLVRKPGTGSNFQCLDLSNQIISNENFKCVDFRGSKFDRVVWMRVHFSHCNFSHTDMKKTAFVLCHFHGERTIFVGTKTLSPNGTRFVQCTVESHKSWCESDNFMETMRARELQIDQCMIVNSMNDLC